ncbi:hypothetical protein PILCRDRAFT_827722 [Piloderma croceum F 1598]|uniref:Uncharacterized protein n=1 Tax=Piloderma croceum (strain F 1598) TaxID=765440 RepID=A0A0C3AM85_PILCF|nr:hypothetical protein PILCRDRAFT_827722 [Piloderma croceum F 1598]
MAANILIRQPYFRAKPYTAFPLSLATCMQICTLLSIVVVAILIVQVNGCAHRNSSRTSENEQRIGKYWYESKHYWRQ